MGTKSEYFTNRYEKVFSNPLYGTLKIIKRKSDDTRFCVPTEEREKREGKEERLEVKKISFYSFLMKEYRGVLFSFAMVIVFILVAIHNLYLFGAIAIFELLFFYLKKQNKLRLDDMDRYFRYFHYTILMEMVGAIGYIFFAFTHFLLHSDYLSMIFMFDFYLFFRMAFYVLYLRFHTIYVMLDTQGCETHFYLWKPRK